MIQGNRKEFVGYCPKVGFFQGKVLMVNPDLEAISKHMSIDNIKEPDYTGKDYTDSKNQQAYKQTIVTFYLQAHDGSILQQRFPLVNRPRPMSTGGNIQYINNLGNTTWAKDENALKDKKFAWFTKRPYRVALQGEEALYDFLQKWLSLDYKDPDTELELDAKKMFNGNFKELQSLLKMEKFAEATIVGYGIIHTSIPAPTEENPTPDPKVYQNLWRKFLLGNAWRLIHSEVKPGDEAFIVPLKDRVLPTFVQDYIDDMGGDYGCKDFYGKIGSDNKVEICEWRDYDPSENVVASSENIHVSEGEHASNQSGSNKIEDDGLPF